MNCAEAHGWLDKEDADIGLKGIECEICTDFVVYTDASKTRLVSVELSEQVALLRANIYKAKQRK